MDTLLQLQRLLSESADPENPTPEELRDLLLRVRHIAVIGLSRSLEKAARRVPSYLAAKGYDVIPVNPFATRILGKTAYDTVSEVPDTVDMVVIFRPSDQAGPFVEESAARPERPAIWLQEGIFSPTEIAGARADGIPAVQNLCVFKVHRALFN